MKPKLSIIMGVFNAESTLTECIKSIQNQTLTNWEFIICDDSSTDKSLEILNQFAEKDKRIKIIKNKQNQGLASSLNNCIQYTSTNILARQDADDTSESNRLELQLIEFNKLKCSVLGCYANLVEKKIKWGVRTPPVNPELRDWLKGSQVIHAASMMNKTDILKMGGYNPKALRVEDMDLWYRLLQKGYKIQSIPYYLYNIEWGKNDYKRKKLKFRILEIKYMAIAFSKLPLPLWKYFYLLKPLIASFTPKSLLYIYHVVKFKKQGNQ